MVLADLGEWPPITLGIEPDDGFSGGRWQNILTSLSHVCLGQINALGLCVDVGLGLSVGGLTL